MLNKDKLNDGGLKTTTKAPDFRSHGLQPQDYIVPWHISFFLF